MTHEPIYDRDTEMTLLGDMMDTPSIISSVFEIVEVNDFYLKSHQIVFDAIKKVYSERQSSDIRLVGKAIKESGNLKRVGGLPVLFDMLEYAVDPQNAVYHAEIVRENGNARRLLKGCSDVINLLETKGYQAGMSKLSQIMPKTSTGQTVESLPDIMDTYYLDILAKKAKLDAGEDLDEMTTGFYDFDKQTASERGTMLVIGGSPGSGKSSLMRGIAYNRFKQGKSGLLFTTEMKRSAVSACFYSMLAKVSVKGLQKASLDAAGWLRVKSVHKEVNSLVGWVDDIGHLTLNHIQSVAREKKHEEGLDFIIIDYIQKCSSSGYDTRANALGDYAYELDSLGKELDIHVILISQLNREERGRGRSSGAGYKGSSGIEEAGWCVTSMRGTRIDPRGGSRPDLCEIMNIEVTKDKTASVTMFPLIFEKPTLTFRDTDEAERDLWRNWLSKGGG